MDVDPKLIEFLIDPANYPERPHAITHHETHISHVFVGDSFAYKLKKPVKYDFLDFSSLEKRKVYCDAEVQLNSRLAAQYYLGVIELYAPGTGGYAFSKEEGCSVAEYAVKMRRIPDDRILRNLIEQGALLHGALDPVAVMLARFHQQVPEYQGTAFGGIGSVIMKTEDNFEEIRDFVGRTLDQSFYEELTEYTRTFIARWKRLFGERKKYGFIREGHGDLHSQHVCLTDPPAIYDCIEFNERLRITDVLEDIAFLLMDLEFQGRFDLSNRLFKTYFSVQKDALINELLRFYKVYRAVVRAKVEGLTGSSVEDEAGRQEAIRRAREYYALADYYIKAKSARFNPVIFIGVSGSGKSAIAADVFPGALWLRSDTVRKEISGVDAKEHVYVEYGKDIYDAEATEKTYQLLAERTVKEAGTGRRVIVDATYLEAAQRVPLLNACLNSGLNPFFVHCCAAEPLLKKRIEGRVAEGADPSDAHMAILERQLSAKEEPAELPFFRVMNLNTDEDLEDIRKALREGLG